MIKRSQGFETAAAIKGNKQMNMAKAHHLLGHTNHQVTVDTATYLGWGKLKDSGVICQPYSEANSKQKLVPQARRVTRLMIPNERLYHELVTVKAPADFGEKVSKPH